MNVYRFPVIVGSLAIARRLGRRRPARETADPSRAAGPRPIRTTPGCWWSATARAASGRCATATTGTSAAPTSWPTSRRSPARSPAASAGSRSTCRSSPREKEPGFVRKKITFAAEPGDRVPAWLLIPDGPRRPGEREAAAPGHALPAPDGRDRQGRARRPGRQARPALRDGAGPARLRRDRPRLSRLRRVQDRRLQAGVRQRHDEGDLEQPAGRRRALRPGGGRRRSDRRDRPLARRPQRDLHGALRAEDPGGRLVLRLQRVPLLLQGQHRRLVAQGIHAPAPRDAISSTWRRSPSTSPS